MNDKMKDDTSEWHHQEQLEEQQQQQAGQEANRAILAYVKTCLTLNGLVTKDRTNPHFKSGYASLQAVLSNILPACHANNLTPLQEIIETPTGIAVKTTLIHVSGDVFELLPCPIPVDKNTAQGVISASTYGRRVSLLAIFCQAPAESDDDGNAATSSPPKPDAKAVEILTEAANTGLEEYRAAWKSLSKPVRATIPAELQESFKKILGV